MPIFEANEIKISQEIQEALQQDLAILNFK